MSKFIASLLGAVLVLGSFAVATSATPKQGKSAALLADARRALGGETRLASVKTFVLKGRIELGRSPASQSSLRGRPAAAPADAARLGAFEIDCELPDKFVRIDNRQVYNPSGARGGAATNGEPAVQLTTQTTGFNGDLLIANQGTSALSQAVARAAFVNVTLGIFASSFAGLPLQFSDAPGSDQSVLVSGAISGAEFHAILTFDPQTHLPSTLNDMTYADYRDVSGVKIPFRFISDREELNVTDARVDASIQASVFKVKR
jgi:hypothetical protein